MYYVAYCKKCGYGIPYSFKGELDDALKGMNGCPNCSQLVRLKNGGRTHLSVLNEHNKKCTAKWQNKQAAKKNKSKISIITGAILAGLAAISGFIISFLEEIKAFLAQASNLIVEIIDIISSFFSSFG